NLYAYVGNDPINQTDGLGTSAAWIHQWETWNAAIEAGYSPDAAYQLMNAVIGADFSPGSQGTDPASAHKHGMGGRKDKNHDPEDRCQAYNGAKNALNQDIKGAEAGNQQDLADALHLIQDSYASSHNYQLWNGHYTTGHFIGDSIYHTSAVAASYALLEAFEGNLRIENPASY